MKVAMCIRPLILVILLLPEPAIAGPAGDRIRTKSPERNILISSRKGEKMEGDMTVKDKLTADEGKYLLGVARKTIEQKLFDQSKSKNPETDLSKKFNKHLGTFVTLTKGENLRGCIGHIIPQESLIQGIRVNAINAAFHDPRFPSLKRDEWSEVKIEISILTDPKPLSYTNADDLLKKLRPGIDGVILKKGFHQATFLPQVWEQLPTKEKFLTHLSLKAGLAGGEWKKGNLEILTYQVQAFEEH